MQFLEGYFCCPCYLPSSDNMTASVRFRFLFLALVTSYCSHKSFCTFIIVVLPLYIAFVLKPYWSDAKDWRILVWPNYLQVHRYNLCFTMKIHIKSEVFLLYCTNGRRAIIFLIIKPTRCTKFSNVFLE
jgi:hypothetical protein